MRLKFFSSFFYFQKGEAAAGAAVTTSEPRINIRRRRSVSLEPELIHLDRMLHTWRSNTTLFGNQPTAAVRLIIIWVGEEENFSATRRRRSRRRTSSIIFQVLNMSQLKLRAHFKRSTSYLCKSSSSNSRASINLDKHSTQIDPFSNLNSLSEVCP